MVNTSPCPSFSLDSEMLRWGPFLWRVSSLLLYQSILPLLVGTGASLTASLLIASICRKPELLAGEARSGQVLILLRDPQFQGILSQNWHRALFQPLNPTGWGLDTPYIFLFLFISHPQHSRSCFQSYVYILLGKFFSQRGFLLPFLSDIYVPHHEQLFSQALGHSGSLLLGVQPPPPAKRPANVSLPLPGPTVLWASRDVLKQTFNKQLKLRD